ncbi:MAG: hypothetical protein QOF54_1483, partial [Solirubrobacteraceae bacterium]|nr:hypothetical protein [Solirubrobacteraceae bacterium]
MSAAANDEQHARHIELVLADVD